MATPKPDINIAWAENGTIVKPDDVKIDIGWSQEIPPFQFENWIQQRQDLFLKHVNEFGIAQWDELTPYPIDGMAYRSGSVYKSDIDDNTNNDPDTPSPNWFKTAAAELITSSKNDATEGRITKAGDFGIGLGESPSITDLDLLFTGGIFSYTNGTANTPVASTFGTVLAMFEDPTHGSQLAIQRDTAEVYKRIFNLGLWGAWDTVGSGVPGVVIDTPVNILPPDGAVDEPVQPTLTASPFNVIVGNDVHNLSQWQVATDVGFTNIVYDSGAIGALESHTVQTPLSLDTLYFFRVRYAGVSGTFSDFSVPTDFTTTDFALNNVFRTSIYTGTGSTLSIVSGLDFAGIGGAAWIKKRSSAENHAMYDTLRGALQTLQPNETSSESQVGNSLISFNNDGITVGNNTRTGSNGAEYVVWQWLIEQGFYDLQTYIGNSATQVITHNLNNEVGHMIIKNRSTIVGWANWHRTFNGSEFLQLNERNAKASSAAIWNNTSPTASDFSVGNTQETNFSGNNYIAEIFAHNPTKGIFCSSYSGTSIVGNKQTTGFPVGFVIIKKTSAADDWRMYDNVRSGGANENIQEVLVADLPDAEEILTVSNAIDFESDGFSFNGFISNQNGSDYIFIAIADPFVF